MSEKLRVAIVEKGVLILKGGCTLTRTRLLSSHVRRGWNLTLQESVYHDSVRGVYVNLVAWCKPTYEIATNLGR